MTCGRIYKLSALMLLVSLAGSSSAAEVELTDEKERTLYALGMMIASRIPQFDPTAEEIDTIMAGMKDGLQGKEPRVDMSEYAKRLEPFIQQRLTRLSQAETAAGNEFRKGLAQQAGAVTTDSGVIYIELETGSGAQPGSSDSVKVHYEGQLRDGTVFDSSIDRGEPVTYRIDGVAPCLSEGLQKMKVGGKAKVVCPPETAYGNRGAPGIPPGATLVFEVQLLEIAGSGASGGGS